MFQLCACHSDIPQYNSSETFRNVPLLLSHVCLCAVRFDGYETAKENGLDPYQYLLWILRNAPQLSETDEAWAEKLLPARAPKECYVPQK